MELILLLMVIGALLLTAEIFVPGGILGVFGGAALLGACILSFIRFGTGVGFLSILGSLLFVACMLFLEFKVFPKTKLGKQMFVQSKVEGVSHQMQGTDALIGAEGEVLTTLCPSGYIVVNGTRYDAFSNSGHLVPGTRVRICSRDTFRLVVTQIT